MTLSDVSQFRCVSSGRTWPAAEALARDLWINDEFGLDGILAIEYDLERVRRGLSERPLAARPWSLGHWRYAELLPLSGAVAPPPLLIGATPLVESPRLAAEVGLARLWLKDEGRNATGSLKDRPSSVGAVKALEAGATHCVAASTGNAASSFAAACAAAGLPVTIFVPRRAPKPKIAQLLLFGARVLRVDADYDTTWMLSHEIAQARGWYSRNCAVNPYLVEGKKTCALEIVEQLRPDAAPGRPAVMPDWIVASVGDGCTLAALAKGFEEMHALGLADRVPRMLGTQAAGADPITRAWAAGATAVERFEGADTVADSICVGRPANGHRCVRAVRATHGAMVSVSDAATIAAMRLLPRLTGIFAEPAAANALAGLVEARARGLVAADESAVVVVSGNGLKDIDTAMHVAGAPLDIPPDPDAVPQ